MNLREWADATSINAPGLTTGERERRRRYRVDVLKRAKTTKNSISNALCRGKVGIDLARRLEVATSGTFAEFKVLDQMPELRDIGAP